MNTFTLLSLLITISISLSKAIDVHGDGGGGGFIVDLIHKHSPLSPLYNPTYDRYDRLDRLHNAFISSISRASRILKKAGFTSKIDADISAKPGEYVMHIQIGNPPVTVVGIVDTGSDLTWAQCQPCKNCYDQGNLPFVQSNGSSTYRAKSCQSKACEALDNYRLTCSANNICEYEIDYGDGSYTQGDLAKDTFWFGPTPFENVVFGCSHDNNGTFDKDASGIVGLGGGPLSIINQLHNTVHGKFSYCLVSALTNSSNVTGKIHFGDDAVVTGPGVLSTPLRRSIPSTYYYVTLEHVSVGKHILSYKGTTAMRNAGLNSNDIIIDSGTTLTLVTQEFYNELTAALTTTIGGKTVSDPQGVLDLCYKNLDFSQVPTITFSFTGADIELSAEKTFIEVDNGVSCFTILPTKDITIFGNLLQQNLLIGFDLVNNKVSFRPTDCSNPN